jgi:hypothetical protein
MFNAIPIKIPMTFITEIEKSTLKFIWKHKRLRISKVILSKKDQCQRYHNIRLQNILQSHSKKTAWRWHKNRHEDQWNRIKDPDMKPHSCAHLIFDKGAKNTWCRKDSHFNKCCWEKWISACRKLKLDPLKVYPFRVSWNYYPVLVINSKWIKDLNIRPETLKWVQERARITGINRHNQDFLNRIQIAQQLRVNKSYQLRLINRTTWNWKTSVQKKKWSPNRRGCTQNGRKSLPAIHVTRD